MSSLEVKEKAVEGSTGQGRGIGESEVVASKDASQPRGRRLKRCLMSGSRYLEWLLWTPRNARWDADQPPAFSLSLNLLFGFAAAFTVANLYYNHPILNILAEDFGVPYVKVAEIPTLAQAGYAVGLFLLCPLGDMVRRRPFVLGLVFLTATMSIALAVTESIGVFSAIQFLTGVTTVTPQLMLPLVADLAPPKRRASALSIVVSGLMLGVLIARLLSGIVAQYTSWRNIYWMSVGLQYAIFISLWLFMPDYPATNSGLRYHRMIGSMFVMLYKHAVLVQACLISFFISAAFTGFWTVLTFLLAGSPYNYGSVTIGLFALIGISGLLMTPLYARMVMDRFVPLFSVVLGLSWTMVGVVVGTFTGEITVAGPVIQAFLADFGMQTCQIANRMSIYTVEIKGRNRVNTVFMLFTFFGQLCGTSISANLYARGGWIASGGYSVATVGAAMLVTLMRGPHEKGWMGWKGGWNVRRQKPTVDGAELVAATDAIEAGACPSPTMSETLARNETAQKSSNCASPSSTNPRRVDSA